MLPNDLPEAARLERLLRLHGLHASKGLGQHFLADEKVLRSIASAANPGPDAAVLEIGSGVGNLTHLLSLSGASVTGIEIDPKFQPLHREIFTTRPSGAGPVVIHYVDALRFDYHSAHRQAVTEGRRFIIVGNIPYQITSPLIMLILESRVPFESMTLMMQREVAERLTAHPGTKRNGGISIKVQYYCNVETVTDVPPNAFIPPPEVDSRVVKFIPRDELELGNNTKSFFQLIDASFAQRRKMLPNSVASQDIGYTREQLDAALGDIGKPLTTRAEQLGLKEFLELYDALRQR